jgi:hypothetical protein
VKITAVLNPENKYRNALYLGNRMLINANSGLKDIRIQYDDNKRAVLYLTLTEFNIVIQNDKCPEAGRFNEILAAFGDKNLMKGLNPACEMLGISATACDGCPKNPNKVLNTV